MGKYNCEKCGKEFKQKSHYTAHANRKNPCVVESKMKEMDRAKVPLFCIVLYAHVGHFLSQSSV